MICNSSLSRIGVWLVGCFEKPGRFPTCEMRLRKSCTRVADTWSHSGTIRRGKLPRTSSEHSGRGQRNYKGDTGAITPDAKAHNKSLTEHPMHALRIPIWLGKGSFGQSSPIWDTNLKKLLRLSKRPE